MNYQRIYNEFINDRLLKQNKISGYSEKHHILPRSLGGDDSSGNIIRLTAQDHYFAHELLAAIHGGSMWVALFFMSGKNTNSAVSAKINRSMYEKSKIEMAALAGVRARGPNGCFTNKNKFNIQNRKTKEKYHGTMYDFCRAYNLCHKPVSMICSGERKTHKDWFCSDIYSITDVTTRKKTPSKSKNTGDKNIYEFTHDDGKKFKGSRIEFMRLHEMSAGYLSSLISGNSKKAKGWSVVKITDIPTKNMDHKIYIFKKGDIIFKGTMVDFYSKNDDMKPLGVARLRSGVCKTYKGWEFAGVSL